MANKSSKSPSGEDREHDPHVRHQEVEQQDITRNTGTSDSNSLATEKKEISGSQENMQNRGFQEDQPGNPVRTTGSTKDDQEVMPTGEPEKSDY